MLIISTISNWLLALLAMLKESANKEKAMSTSGKKVSAEIGDENLATKNDNGDVNKELTRILLAIAGYLVDFDENNENIKKLQQQVFQDIECVTNDSHQGKLYSVKPENMYIIKVMHKFLESKANERKWVKRLDKSYAGKTRALGCAVALTCFFFSAPINPVFFVGLAIIGLGIIMSYSGWNKTKAEVQKANEELSQIKPLQEKITSIVAKNNTQPTQRSGWFSLFSGRDLGTVNQEDLNNLMKDEQGFLRLFGGI